MSILKVIEIMASSTVSWEDAVKNAVHAASKTVKGIRSVYIQDQSATVVDGEVKEFRVTTRITFEVFEH
jgi:flavin-binding protein dodecin